MQTFVKFIVEVELDTDLYPRGIVDAIEDTAREIVKCLDLTPADVSVVDAHGNIVPTVNVGAR